MRARVRGVAAVVATAVAVLVGCGDGASEVSESAERDTAAGASPVGLDDRAPLIESVRIEPREPAVGDVVRAVVMARDPDGDRIALGHRWFIDGGELSVGDASLELRDVHKGARVGVVVTASDGTLESESVRAEVEVIDRVPQVAAIELSPSNVVPPGTPVEALAAATDPDGDRVDLEYGWSVNGKRTDATGSVFSTEGLRKDDLIRAEVRATDGRNWSQPMRSKGVIVGSSHPKITSQPPGFRSDGVFHYTVTAEDPDGDRRLRYGLAEAPEGMVIDEVLGEITWRPGDAQVGVHPVKVVVRNSAGLETKQSFEVTVRSGDAPPASTDSQ